MDCLRYLLQKKYQLMSIYYSFQMLIFIKRFAIMKTLRNFSTNPIKQSLSEQINSLKIKGIDDEIDMISFIRKVKELQKLDRFIVQIS